MLNGFSPGFLFQMEMSSGVAECLCTLHALIVAFLFLFFLSMYRFCGKQVLLNLGKCEVAVNVVECDF